MEHIYSAEGGYTVELTVRDAYGETSKSTTYANISLQSNGQNGGDENGDSEKDK